MRNLCAPDHFVATVYKKAFKNFFSNELWPLYNRLITWPTDETNESHSVSFGQIGPESVQRWCLHGHLTTWHGMTQNNDLSLYYIIPKKYDFKWSIMGNDRWQTSLNHQAVWQWLIPWSVQDVTWFGADAMHLCRWTLVPVQGTLGHLSRCKT